MWNTEPEALTPFFGAEPDAGWSKRDRRVQSSLMGDPGPSMQPGRGPEEQREASKPGEAQVEGCWCQHRHVGLHPASHRSAKLGLSEMPGYSEMVTVNRILSTFRARLCRFLPLGDAQETGPRLSYSHLPA